jgi:hypothetical protein
MATILLLYILQKFVRTEAEYFSKIYYHTSFQSPELSGAIHAST